MREILQLAWDRFKIIAAIAGDAQANVIATLFYFTIVAPFGLISRLSSDPLRLTAPQQGSEWLERDPVHTEIEAAKRQG